MLIMKFIVSRSLMWVIRMYKSSFFVGKITKKFQVEEAVIVFFIPKGDERQNIFIGRIGLYPPYQFCAEGQRKDTDSICRGSLW